MSPELYLRSVNHSADAATEMRAIDVCQEGIDIMLPKMRHFIFMVRGLDPRGANILKQEMLAVGGEAAISYNSICDISKPTDCLLSGTERQFQIAQAKLKIQPFGLKDLAAQLKLALQNICRQKSSSVGQLKFDRTLVMGILNVTPDSFSGEGTMNSDEAVERALQMEHDGADIIDIGGESTRPGARTVTTEEELARVIPVIESLAGKLKIPMSIDTRNPDVAEKALEAGVGILNLVGGLRVPRMADIVAVTGKPVILMHMQGEPGNMQENPAYSDVMDDIIAELRQQIVKALEAGIKSENIILDPGIGFGKTAEHNLEILRRLGELRILGMPVLVGTSRKSFIGTVIGRQVNSRLEGSLASAVLASSVVADIVRVHDVKETAMAMKMTDTIIKKSTKTIK